MRICCMLARSKRCARVSRGYMQAANVTARLPPLTSCAPPCVCFFLPLPFSRRRRLAVRGGRRGYAVPVARLGIYRALPPPHRAAIARWRSWCPREQCILCATFFSLLTPAAQAGGNRAEAVAR
jgi:hypothetical protein